MGPLDPIAIAGIEEEYEVESILRHHRWGGAMEYLVHWHGYDKAKDRWVLDQDLIYAQQFT